MVFRATYSHLICFLSCFFDLYQDTKLTCSILNEATKIYSHITLNCLVQFKETSLVSPKIRPFPPLSVIFPGQFESLRTCPVLRFELFVTASFSFRFGEAGPPPARLFDCLMFSRGR